MAEEDTWEAARQAPLILTIQTVPSKEKGLKYTIEDLIVIHQDTNNWYDTKTGVAHPLRKDYSITKTSLAQDQTDASMDTFEWW